MRLTSAPRLIIVIEHMSKFPVHFLILVSNSKSRGACSLNEIKPNVPINPDQEPNLPSVQDKESPNCVHHDQRSISRVLIVDVELLEKPSL